MKDQKDKKCVKCGEAEHLRECNACGAILCGRCSSLPKIGGDIPKVPHVCAKCGSHDITLFDDIKKTI